MIKAALGYLERNERPSDGRASTNEAIAAAPVSSATGAVASSTIPEMYEEWLAERNRPAAAKTDAEMDEDYSHYADLQSRIIAAEPQAPRDVAIMYLVDTDDGNSHVSDELERRVRQLAQENRQTPARPSTLVQLIATYTEAKRVWEAQWLEDEDKAGDSVEWDTYQNAGDAILNYPCASMNEIRIKAAFVLSEENLTDTLMNCYRATDGATEYCLLPFLRSMLSGEVARP